MATHANSTDLMTSCSMIFLSSLRLWRDTIFLIMSFNCFWICPMKLAGQSNHSIRWCSKQSFAGWGDRSSKTRATLLESSCDVMNKKRLLWKSFLITIEMDTLSSGSLVANYIRTTKFFSRPDCSLYPDRLLELNRYYNNEVWPHRMSMSFKKTRLRLRFICTCYGDQREKKVRRYCWWSETLPG